MERCAYKRCRGALGDRVLGVCAGCRRPSYFDETRAELPAIDTTWDRERETAEQRDELFVMKGLDQE